jgi:hypothetical protein
MNQQISAYLAHLSIPHTGDIGSIVATLRRNAAGSPAEAAEVRPAAFWLSPAFSLA